MNDRTYTEAELRRRLGERHERLAQEIVGRLRDDGLFDPVHWQLTSQIGPDGQAWIDEAGMAVLREKLTAQAGTMISETIKATLSALFDEEE